MKVKILDVSEAVWRDLITDSDRNWLWIGTKNIFAYTSKKKRTLFVPRSAIGEQGRNKGGRMSDSAYEPNFDPKFSVYLTFK